MGRSRLLPATFDDFMAEVEAEARAEGPQAIAEFERWGAHFELASELLRRRRALKLTQAQLAKKVGVKQSEISRLEGGQSNPTWTTLQSVLGALGAKLAVVDKERPLRNGGRR